MRYCVTVLAIAVGYYHLCLAFLAYGTGLYPHFEHLIAGSIFQGSVKNEAIFVSIKKYASLSFHFLVAGSIGIENRAPHGFKDFRACTRLDFIGRCGIGDVARLAEIIVRNRFYIGSCRYDDA